MAELIATEEVMKHLPKLNDLAIAFKDLYNMEVINGDSVASGELSKDGSQSAYIDWDGEVFRVVFQMPEYWLWMETGRPPNSENKPPSMYPNILQWIRTKGIVPRAGSNGVPPSQEQLAYMITKKIRAKGYDGRHYLEKAKEKAKADGIYEKITDEISAIFNGQVNVWLTELSDV